MVMFTASAQHAAVKFPQKDIMAFAPAVTGAGWQAAPNGQRGAMLRAYDKATGKEVGEVYMPAPQTGSPMTYMLNGTQYVTVSIAGPGYPAELLVLKVGK